MLGLVVVAAIPLLAFVATNVGLQATSTDDHARAGHYGFMAAFGIAVIAVGLLASLRPDGWWLPAWVASLLPILLGVTSLLFPGNSSSLDAAWALAAITWGAVFIVVAELTQDAANPSLIGAWRAASKGHDGARPEAEPAARSSRVANVFGIVALVPIVLFFALPLLAGGAPGGHAPGVGAPSSSAGHIMGDSPPIAGAHELPVTANSLAFSLEFGRERIDLGVGQAVNVALTSVDTLHDLTVDEIDFHVTADAGETVVGGLVLDRPGTYVGYCSVPGHREAGMEIEIVVR